MLAFVVQLVLFWSLGALTATGFRRLWRNSPNYFLRSFSESPLLTAEALFGFFFVICATLIDSIVNNGFVSDFTLTIACFVPVPLIAEICICAATVGPVVRESGDEWLRQIDKFSRSTKDTLNESCQKEVEDIKRNVRTAIDLDSWREMLSRLRTTSERARQLVGSRRLPPTFPYFD